MKNRRNKHHTPPTNNNLGYQLKDIILGGQDGIVNVLGVVLIVAEATNTTPVILIAGLATTFAESLSMAAVAYTSSKAVHDYYQGRLQEEQAAITTTPKHELRKIQTLYAKKGFKGKLLQDIIRHISKKKELFTHTIMIEEHHLFPEEYQYPLRNATIVGAASLIGSFIPLLPFFTLPVKNAVPWAIIASTLTLFITGAVKAKITIGNWIKSGLHMATIGILAALAGYLIGKILGVIIT